MTTTKTTNPFPLGQPAFLSNVLDRAAHLRTDDAKLFALEGHRDARAYVVHRDSLVVKQDADGPRALLTLDEALKFGANPGTIFLGLRDGAAVFGMVPVGASKCVGASRSSRARKSHGNSAISASDRSPAEKSFSDVLSNNAGTSHASLVSTSAASERSGQGSPSAARRNITRSRHCLSALDHGRRSRPAATRPSPKIPAVSCVGDTGRTASDRVIA